LITQRLLEQKAVTAAKMPLIDTEPSEPANLVIHGKKPGVKERVRRRGKTGLAGRRGTNSQSTPKEAAEAFSARSNAQRAAAMETI
jgi:hypothetical protein